MYGHVILGQQDFVGHAGYGLLIRIEGVYTGRDGCCLSGCAHLVGRALDPRERL